MKRIFLASTALIVSPLGAQSWTVGPVTPAWVDNPTIGQGLNTHSEVFTTTQGGDPPALAYEPANVDENNYTRTQWINTDASTTGQAEAKFRISCEFSGFAQVDAILAYGGVSMHHHTFFGAPPSSTANFTNLRNLSGKTTCSGGPLNRSAYWETTWVTPLTKAGVLPTTGTLINPGVFVASGTNLVSVPRKPNIASFYYTGEIPDADKDVRLFNGMSVIFGADPNDRLNTAGLNEIPDGQGWMKTRRYNGWGGWQCYSGLTGAVNPDAGSTADIEPQSGLPRQWLNADGSDPWGGRCDSTVSDPKILIPILSAPDCWDGTNLTSPDGRKQWRFPIVKSAAQNVFLCPDKWFRVKHLEVKVEYPATSYAIRKVSYLSSDRMATDPASWQPNGSTMHADLITAWDSVIRDRWLRWCGKVTINGTTGEAQECNGSTIQVTTSPARLLVGETPPNTALANTPVVTFRNYNTGPSKDKYGKPIGTVPKLDAHAGH